MGNKLKKVETRLKQRQAAYDSVRSKAAFTRPGSMNPKKNSVPQGKK